VLPKMFELKSISDEEYLEVAKKAFKKHKHTMDKLKDVPDPKIVPVTEKERVKRIKAAFKDTKQRLSKTLKKLAK
jgi:hypothetical protein